MYFFPISAVLIQNWSDKYIIEDQAFSPSYDLAPSPSPPKPSHVSKLSQSSCVSPVELTDERGGWGAGGYKEMSSILADQ